MNLFNHGINDIQDLIYAVVMCAGLFTAALLLAWRLKHGTTD